MELHQESTTSRPWTADTPPARILVIRLHAIGDVAITFPACVSLRTHLPGARIDYLTGEGTRRLAESMTLFDSVFGMVTSGAKLVRLWRTCVLGIRLATRRYDLVIDLQRNWVSRLVRWLCVPRAWSEFDRHSLVAAGDRVTATIHRAGFQDLRPTYSLPVRNELLAKGRKTLGDSGWDGIQRLIVINPAGLWGTRNWPLDHYGEFCRSWLNAEPVRFLLLGTERIRRKGELLEHAVGSAVLNLIGRTTLAEALAILQFSSFVLSEDSGLMHLSWTSGIPTLALFGSSRHQWSMPLGDHSLCFHSGDLACGACMEPTCRFGDVHCLTRFTPRMAFDAARSIVGTGVPQRVSL